MINLDELKKQCPENTPLVDIIFLYFKSKMKPSAVAGELNPYGTDINKFDEIAWRDLDIDKRSIKKSGIKNFIKNFENGISNKPIFQSITPSNIHKYFEDEYGWDEFVNDITFCKDQIVSQRTKDQLNTSAGTLALQSLLVSCNDIKICDVDLFKSPKFKNKFTEADDYFIFNRLYRDYDYNLYMKLKDRYFLLKFKPNDERTLITNSLDKDGDFWSYFFDEFKADFDKWNNIIIKILDSANTKKVSAIEDTLLESGVPRIYLESLKIQVVLEGIKILINSNYKTEWQYKQCVILPNNGNKPSWSIADQIAAFSKSLMQSVDINRVNKIKVFSNDKNEEALIHIKIPVAKDCSDMPVMPEMWSKFLDDNRFFNPIVDRLKIAKFILNTLDASYSGRQVLILTGEGHDGKGVFLDVLSNMLTEELAVSLNVNAFNEEDRFALGAIHNKKLIYLSDCKSVSKLFASDKFKALTGHDTLTLEQKYSRAISYKPSNITVAIATNATYYVNNEHGRTRVLPVVFRKNYTKATFIDKNSMTNALIAEKTKFLQWCVDYVEYMKNTYKGIIVSNMIMNCCDSDLDNLDNLSEEEAFKHMCETELLNGSPCCRWNERTEDEESDAQVFAEVLDKVLESFITDEYNDGFKLKDFITFINTQLNPSTAESDLNNALKLVIDSTRITMNSRNKTYTDIINYFKSNEKYTFIQEAKINYEHIRNYIQINKKVNNWIRKS